MNVVDAADRAKRSFHGPRMGRISPFPDRSTEELLADTHSGAESGYVPDMQTITINQPLTTQELSELLQIPARALEGWRLPAAEGRVPRYGPSFWYAGKRVRYSPEDVQEWIDAQRTEAA